MRILLVTHLALPHYRAGVESYTHQLAQELGKRGDVTVATTRKVISLATGTVRDYVHEGVRTIEVINNLDGETYASTHDNATMERAFDEILTRTKPDVVHFNHVMFWSSRLPAAVKAHGAKRLFTLHDFFLLCARMGQLIDHHGASCEGPSTERCAPCMAVTPWGQSPAARKWIRRLTAVRRTTGVALDRPMRALERARSKLRSTDDDSPGAATVDTAGWGATYDARHEAYLQMVADVDAFVTPSRTLRNRFIDWGIPATKIHRVGQGLDPTPFASVRRTTADRLRLGFVGTIAPHKGVLDLVQAVRELPADRVELAVYGRTDQHRDYADACQRAAAGAGNIEFRGFLTRAEIPRAYETIDVLCVPSRWDECAPLTIQESFLAGAPCVVSGRGGLAELVTNDVDGLHARDGDVADWTRTLRRLLDEPDLVDRLRDGIRPVPTVTEHVDALVALYEDPTVPAGNSE